MYIHLPSLERFYQNCQVDFCCYEHKWVKIEFAVGVCLCQGFGMALLYCVDSRDTRDAKYKSDELTRQM